MERRLAIRREQALSMHKGQPLVTLGNLGGATCALLILLHVEALSPNYVIGWYLAFVFQTVGAFWYWRSVRPEGMTDFRSQARWFAGSVVNLACLGVLWGAIFLPVLVAGNTALQFAILAGSAMLCSGAMASTSAYLAVYLTFLFSLQLSITVVLLSLGSWLNVGMGISSGLFLCYMYWSGRRFNASYLESLHLRFENLDLVHELRLQKEAAEGASVAKSRFLAAASHDLRQPMHALNLYHGALELKPLGEEARQLLGNARQCAAAMDDMFAVLLDMSKLDAGLIRATPKGFPIADILDRIRVEFTPVALEKRLELRVVPSSACIDSDPALAARIVRNLVANAVRYTNQGRILVGCRRRGGSLQVLVADTGVGIPEDKLEAIFEEYVQLDNPERDRSKGLGLGLAIVQRLGRLLNAPIRVFSRRGKGSTFSVEFGLASAALVSQSKGELPSEQNLAGRLVVVIDDDAMILNAAKTMLEQLGCSVFAAESADAAVNRLAMSRRPPDVIVCDYRLRGDETGLDAIEKLRSEFSLDIPALLVTGDTSPHHATDVRAIGLPIVHKPLQPEAFCEALIRLCAPALEAPL